MPLDPKLTAAIGRLRTDVDRTHAALIKHERALARDHQHDDGRRELYGLIHRLRVVLFDVKNSLDTAPTR
jgi:hypothetical protein